MTNSRPLRSNQMIRQKSWLPRLIQVTIDEAEAGFVTNFHPMVPQWRSIPDESQQVIGNRFWANFAS